MEENLNRREMIRSITKKIIQRKNVDRFLEKKLKESKQIEESKELESTQNKFFAKTKLKKITLFLLINVASLYWQTIVSFLSCAIYVIGTYYPSSDYEYNFF